MPKNRGSGQPRHVVVARDDNENSIASLTWTQILSGQAFKASLAQMIRDGRDFLIEITFPSAYPAGRVPRLEQKSFFHVFRQDEIHALLELMDMFRAFQKVFKRQVTPAEIATLLESGRLVLVPEGDAAERPTEAEGEAPAVVVVPAPIVTATNGDGPKKNSAEPVTAFGGGRKKKAASADEGE